MDKPILNDFEIVAEGIYLEGLAIDYERNTVWCSDVIAGGLWGRGEDGAVTSLNPERMWTGGVLMNQDGCVLSSGAGGIMWNRPATGESGWLLKEIDGAPINGVNEMVPDGQGGIFFGSSDIEMVMQGGAPRPTKIFRLTQDRRVIEVADGIGFSNGIMYDEARGRLYCNDTFFGTWVFDVDAERCLSNKRVLLKKEDADGMALDAEGNVWITGFRSSALTRISPEGVELDPVQTPAGAITQLRFGGSDMKDVYINAVPEDGGDTLKDGEIPTAKNSKMYRARSAVAGNKVVPANFELQ